MMDALPPLAHALLAILTTGLFCAGGALPLSLMLRPFLGPVSSLLIAWISWPVLAGALVAALSLAGLEAGPVLLTLFAALLPGALLIVAHRDLRRRLAPALIRPFPDGLQRRHALLLPGLVHQGLFLLMAAHPQRLYDQLNYHLVVGRNLLQYGRVDAGVGDPHVLMTGMLEYAAAALRYGVDDPLLAIAQGQVLTWFMTVPVILVALAGLWPEGRSGRSAFLAVALLIVPALLPDYGTDFRLAKADACLLAWAMVMLYVLLRERPQRLPLLLAPTAIGLAMKITALHYLLALLPLFFLRARPGLPWRSLLICLPFCLPFGVFLLKNTLWLGNPVYPAQLPFFPSPVVDGAAMEYWRSIRLAGESGGRDLFGILTWPLRGPVLLLIPAALFLLVRRQATPETDRRLTGRLRGCLLTAAAFTLVLPLFFSGQVYTRFLYPGFAPLLAMLPLLAARGRGLTTPAALLLLLPCLAFSRMDLNLRRMVNWNQTDAVTHMMNQEGFYAVARTVNPMSRPGDHVLTWVDSVRYFFRAGVILADHPPSPNERRMTRDFHRDPVAAAATHRIMAIIWHEDRMATAAALPPRLRERCEFFRFGKTRACISTCYFQQRHCVLSRRPDPLRPAGRIE